MTVSLKYRVQEWLADRFTWVQYPNLHRINKPAESRFRWKHQMSIGKRIDMLLISLFGAVISVSLLAVSLFFVYAFIIAPLFGL